MGMLLSVHHVSKSYGIHVVLSDVSLTLAEGQRVGLVGANGVGKSTLLKIITGEIEPDLGTCTLYAGRTLGYLPQAIAAMGNATLQDRIAQATAHIHSIETQMRALEDSMSHAQGDALQAVMAQYGELADLFERRGGYTLESRIDAVLNGLGVAHVPRDQRFDTLSGGEKSRVGLALLLLESPDVLLLDEPANHLDFVALAWLESYLQSYQGGVLIVSHDRHFLNQTVTEIIEIDEHTHETQRYSGSYDAFRAAKQIARRQWEASYAAEQDEIKALRHEVKVHARRNDNYRTPSDGDKFMLGKKRDTHAATVAKRVRSAEEKLNRILADPIPRPPEDLRFKGTLDPRLMAGKNALTVDRLSKRYGERVIFEDVSFSLGAKARVVLVGPNGVGKSTLLKALAGIETPDAGSVTLHPAAVVGYLDQEGARFEPSMRVFEAYQDGLPQPEQVLKAQLLTMGLFHYDELDKRVGDLSKGQQHKLQIARLIASGANLLILDEPTNFVSFDVLESFEAALREFNGAVIAASHDRRFIQQFEGEVWSFADGRLISVDADIEALAAS